MICVTGAAYTTHTPGATFHLRSYVDILQPEHIKTIQ